MSKYIKASLGIFILGALLTFAKFWHHSYPSYVVWWTAPFFEYLYYALLFIGAWGFLAALAHGIYQDSQERPISDARKLLMSFTIFLFGFLFLYLSLWHRIHSFIRYDMWWQGDLFRIIYQIMFIGGFSATVVMLLKIGMYEIRDHFRQRKSDQNVE